MEERFDYLFRALRAQSTYGQMDDERLRQVLASCIALDSEFMDQSGVAEGEMYDDDAAHAFICKGLARASSEKALADDFVEDYLAYNETYLEEHGEIEWDDD